MATQSIRFPGEHGREIAAKLDLPAGEPRAYALFAHCFTCSKDSKAAAYVSRALAARGIATLRFDFSSLEFASNLQDLVAAASWLREHRAAPQVLAGQFQAARLKRRRDAAVEHRQRSATQLDLTRVELRIDRAFRPRRDGAGNLNHKLRPQRAG